ncbi:peroxisomal membrane protein PEX14-like isoform X3 [Phragmites australis]|uniref:peroxisomal membrane protein PEX14-like isoform X3 n=1 Tax=Phragmites australis TaxID=29695 RepID=UPI002D79E4DD|nr:peroxisomal membrane protein PEX14-like isoform X3 [Phragmites australis]
MEDLSESTDGELADGVQEPLQETGQGSSEGIHSTTTLQDTKEQEAKEGKAALGSAEPMREELVQSAVGFLKHPKVVASSDVQRRSFLENKGLTVDEIDEAFRRLQRPSSDSVSSNACTSQGVFDHSCGITQQETTFGTKCTDGSEKPEPETEPVAPVVPRHPKSYMEIMEMIERGEQPDDIQPWEKHDQESSTWDLKSLSSDSSDSRSEVGKDSTSQATESASGSKHGDSLLQAEVVAGSESPTDDAASSK